MFGVHCLYLPLHCYACAPGVGFAVVCSIFGTWVAVTVTQSTKNVFSVMRMSGTLQCIVCHCAVIGLPIVSIWFGVWVSPLRQVIRSSLWLHWGAWISMRWWYSYIGRLKWTTPLPLFGLLGDAVIWKGELPYVAAMCVKLDVPRCQNRMLSQG